MTRTITLALFLLCALPGFMIGAVGTKGYQGVPAHPDTSAPDTWGYTWVKNTDPGGPTYKWIDITARGTLISGLADDNYVGPFPMQFAFPYYWYTVSSFYAGSNGYINFSGPANFASPFAALPNTGSTIPKDLLAVLAGDLDFTFTATNPRCYYWSNGIDSLVVSFINVNEWRPSPSAPNYRHTFQIVLNKVDSSITYQYGLKEGLFNDATNNYSLSIGWQNQTGQIGLSYYYGTTPPHAGLPDSGVAIKIKRTINTGLSITDAGIVGGFDTGNLGKVISMGVPDTIQAVVKNFGTASFTNAPVRYAITRTGQPSAFDTVIVPSLAPGQQVTVKFPRLFTAAVAGTYSALFNVTVAGDVGPGNNSKTAEILSAAFALNQPTRIQFENGTVSGSTSWTGGGGFGVAIDLPPAVYPVKVESVFVQVGTVTTQPMTVMILDGSTGAPGTILATRNVTAVGSSMNIIDFRSDSVKIQSGRFFVGATGLMQFSYEGTVPISQRTWEYTNGWAPYRSGDAEDIIIRATVRPYTPSGGGCNTFAARWAPTGGFPDLPDTTYFQAAAWLGDTLFVQAPIAGGVASARVFKYTTTGGWTTGVAIPSAKVGGTLTRCGNKLYYIGGGTSSITTGSTDVYEFDPATQAWTTKAPMPLALSAHGAVCWGDSVIFVIGGPYTGAGTNLDVQVYRPAANTWSTISASLPSGQGRRTFACGISASKIVISSGYNTVFLKSTFVGTINSASSITWAAAPDPPTIYTGLSRPGGTAFGDRFYLVCGERAGAGGYYDTTHVFRISTNSWTNIISGKPMKMSNIFNAVTAKCINDTVRVFVPGGYGNPSGPAPGFAQRTFDVINSGSLTSVPDQISPLPGAFRLEQNYPNPFNPSTTIRFTLPASLRLSVKVYNVLGQEVATLAEGVYAPGTYNVTWNAVNFASGVYIYRLQSDSYSATKKLLLLK